MVDTPEAPDGLEQQPASPIATSESFINEVVADDHSVCRTAKKFSKQIRNGIIRRLEIAQSDHASLGSGVVVTVATDSLSADGQKLSSAGPGPTTIKDDQVLLPEDVCGFPGEPVKSHGRLLKPSRDNIGYRNYTELHIEPIQGGPGPVGDQGLISSERRRQGSVRRLGIAPAHIGNRIPGPDNMILEESLPIFDTIGCIFLATPEEDSLPRPAVNADVDLGKIEHVPVFEEGPIGEVPDVVSELTSASDDKEGTNEHRLWLHFMQRTSAADSLSAQQLHELQEAIQNVSNSPTGIRRCLDGAVIEGLVPISP